MSRLPASFSSRGAAAGDLAPHAFGSLAPVRRGFELHPSVAAFFKAETAPLKQLLSRYRGQAKLVDAWIDEVCVRLSDPMQRVIRLEQVDLPNIRGQLAMYREKTKDISAEDLRRAATVPDADEFARIAGEQFPFLQESARRRAERIAEGEKILRTLGDFLAAAASEARAIEQPARKGMCPPKPGSLVQHQYHRDRVLRGALPESSKDIMEIAEVLGADLSWLLRSVGDDLSVRAHIARTVHAVQSPEVRRCLNDTTITVHFPAPLGPEEMSYQKFSTLIEGNAPSSSLFALLAEEIDKHFLDRASSIAQVTGSARKAGS